MPCLFKKHNQATGPLVDVSIHNLHDANYKIYQALIDTGASITSITSRVVKELNLKSFEKEIMITSVHGEKPQKMFYVPIMFPSMDVNKNTVIEKRPLNPSYFAQESHSAFTIPVCVIESHMSEYFDVLIGRDIIYQGALFMTRDHFTFCL